MRTDTAPERIYLVVGEDCPEDAEFKELSEVDWCEHSIYDNDIEYLRKRKDLPLLPSERKRLTDKAIQATIRLDEQWAAALRHCTRIINECDYLDTVSKSNLLDSIWERKDYEQ